MTAPLLRRRTVLSGALGAVALAGCAGSEWPDVDGRVRVATGNAGAVFDRYGAALAERLHARMPGLATEALITGGSVANVRAVVDGDAEVAFCLGDTAVLALDGAAPFTVTQPLVAIARLYDSFLQVLVPAGSTVRDVADLRGRRVAGGEDGSGTRITVTRTLAAAGVDPATVDLVGLSLSESLTRLVDGTVDALCFVSGFPIPAVVELARTFPVRVVDLGALLAPLVAAHGAQYVAGPVPAAPYRLVRPVQTVSIKTHLVASSGLDDDVAYGVAGVVFDDQQAIARLVPDVRQPTRSAGIFTDPIPLHRGSLRWFRDQDGGGA